MCFYVHSKYPEPRVAKKAIVCYKTMNLEGGRLFSACQSFEYELGEEYSLGKPLKIVQGICTRFITEGFHSFSNKKELRTDGIRIKVKCIIPEGSTYYYNPRYRQYVSDRIRIVERI